MRDHLTKHDVRQSLGFYPAYSGQISNSYSPAGKHDSSHLWRTILNYRLAYQDNEQEYSLAVLTNGNHVWREGLLLEAFESSQGSYEATEREGTTNSDGELGCNTSCRMNNVLLMRLTRIIKNINSQSRITE